MKIGKYLIYFKRWFINIYKIDYENKDIRTSTLIKSYGW